MLISVTNGYMFPNRVESVKAVRDAYYRAGLGKMGLKEALEFVRDGKEIEVDDFNANVFVYDLRGFGFDVVSSVKVSVITPEVVINNLFQKYMETKDVSYVYAACEMKRTFGE